MKKQGFLLTLICLLLAFSLQAQHRLIYANGDADATSFTAVDRYESQLKIYSADAPLVNPISGIASHFTYLDYINDTIISQLSYSETEKYWYGATIGGNKYEFEDLGTEKVNGYACRKFKIVLFSNSIELWTTDDLKFRATPVASFASLPGVLVKYSRNGKIICMLKSVEKVKKMLPIFPESFGVETTYSQLNQLEKDKLVLKKQIFNEDQICFSSDFPAPERLESDSVYHFSHGTIILKKVNLDTLPSHYQIYAELTEYSNGDAYDRTGSVFVIPMDAKVNFLQALQQGKEVLPIFTDKNGADYQGYTLTEEYQPLVELIRFFTPFGVRHYNQYRSLNDQAWAEEVYYKQDVSELRSVLCGEVYIGAFIGNYDGGGHKLSLMLKAYPGDETWENDNHGGAWLLPLFNTCNVMEMSGQNYGRLFRTDSLTVTFTVPEGVENIRLRYITTGHGGWGNGDEFVPKENHILIDAVHRFSYTPWCTDCGTFRHFNPASGNFWNGISSSDYSRSGWCPGTAAQPVYFELPDLKPGKHTITIAIPQGADEGSSFSAWSVSGVLLGTKSN